MHVVYWILAVLLALFYCYAGGLKVFRSRERLRPMMAWVDHTPMSAVRAVGAVELLGALGLVLPRSTGIAPWLSAVAVVGFAVLQLAATGVHLRRGDRQVALNIALLALAGIAIWPSMSGS
ncbi:DoxX family protein [Streptomyces sp. NPDC048111]|uniref:DoxX family protein n=1 Tax=Streptomyces sp. NPDC048111 TaxID=3365500 RepID=UPI0037111023